MNSSQDAGTIIFETLKNELLDLTIKPGQEISENEICQRFNVTRPPVRTALRRLSDMGLVEIKPYYGTHASLLNMDKVYQIIHMRTVLEANIICEFINSNPSAFIIEELEHNIRLQEILTAEKEIDSTQFFNLDNQLHLIWYRERNCEHIWNMIQEQKIEYTRFRMLDYKNTMSYTSMVSGHKNLVEAIKQHDTDSIPKLIGRHLHDGIRRTNEDVLKECAHFFIPPLQKEFWNSYTQQYYN
ncbi:GntR family transcriptional regulator [Treponema rectale]|uniref:GntR family transcriptional regulator n=1 Tax=Treponema rectale TaxID=744512 RepID=A0A840SGT5_9SPIR|nr:GntR family transcriptional regulator [Treponema rectale]MBB5219116.1 DNA-binding GntR family transcriptional regulator [Treponema rectale]QOS40982.1 GntR family transcriptional regulator [Treponema rectale]